MIGYHYTSAENYERIKVEGLTRYRIRKPELDPFFPDGIYGIWIWKQDLTGDEHVGSILWQLMTKNSTRVVKLGVEYNETDLLRQYGADVEILHDGRLGQWHYHYGVPAVVVTENIPPHAITLVQAYDVQKCLR
jgi:hypothetical protein